MRRSEMILGVKRRGTRMRRGVIALASCMAGCAGLLGVGADYCAKGTAGCGDAGPPATEDGGAPDVSDSDASAPHHPPPTGPIESDAGEANDGGDPECDLYCER